MSEPIGSRVAGSSDVGLAYLAELERFTATDRSSSPAALRGALLEYLRAVQALQPTLALVHQLAADLTFDEQFSESLLRRSRHFIDEFLLTVRT